MASSPSSVIAKYGLLQLASEGFLHQLGDLTRTGSEAGPGNFLAYVGALTFGNDRSSKFASTQAEQFAGDWEVVAHKSNSPGITGGAGFSGTLFRAKRSDALHGITQGELVLSFRSTEFIDDNLRDSKSTNELEVKDTGWALGQISEMEEWYASLLAIGALDPSKGIPPGAQFSVTGYSLGGHLATAFNILRRDESRASGGENPIIATYTFNGAGVGGLRDGVELGSVIARFDELLGASTDLDPRALRWETVEVASIYDQLRRIDLEAVGGAEWNTWVDALNRLVIPAFTAIRRDANLLHSAVGRLEIILPSGEAGSRHRFRARAGVRPARQRRLRRPGARLDLLRQRPRQPQRRCG